MPRLNVEKTIEELTLGEKVALTAGEFLLLLQTKNDYPTVRLPWKMWA